MSVSSGDTAWILISSALVMLMTPGVALFYGLPNSYSVSWLSGRLPLA